MKKIFIALSAAIALVTSSCSLDETSYGKTTSDNFYETESEVELALTGVYLQYRTTWNEYALNHSFTGDSSTDDALKGGGSAGDRAEVYDMEVFKVFPTNGEVGRRWEILYRVINRANEVIAYGPLAKGQKETLDRYVNEAKALRSFAYYQLVTTFGGVPLVTVPMTPSQARSTPRATADQVFEFIIQDLKEASALPLKGQYDANNAYRVTNGFAQTMLAKTYMFRGDFVAAEQVLENIVKSNQYQLLSDYGANWRPQYENSTESVFEFPNKVEDRNVGTGTNVPHFFTSRRIEGYQGYGFHVPTTDLYNEFDPNDPRMSYIFTRTGDRYIGDEQAQDNTESVSGFYDYKMTVPRIERQGLDPWMISYNIRVIRYSDVLLMYAEALNENNKGTQALTYLNEVRTRARQTNPKDPRKNMQAYIPNVTSTTLPAVTTTDKTKLRDAIWHERRCEFAMEGWRRDDLMRQKRFGEVMRAYAQKYDTEKGKSFNDGRDYLLPIPQGEIDKSNGVLTQNPLY